MMFNACYDYVIQQRKGIYVENHYATYSLCRSMILVSLVAGSLALCVAIHRSATFPGTRWGVLFLIVSITGILVWAFWRGKNRLMKVFATAVYRAFYSAYCDLRMGPHRGGVPGAPDDD